MESDGNRVYRVLQGTGYYNVLQSTGLYWDILGGGDRETKQNFLFLIKIYNIVRSTSKHIFFIVLHYFHGQKKLV